MLEIILLSITQGITEFLPISSSAHLILISNYIHFNNENLTLDISLHLGSLLAVIIFFKKEIVNFVDNKSLFTKIIISSLPTMLIGFLLIKFNIIDLFRNTKIIAMTTIMFGILLFISDKFREEKNFTSDLTLKEAIYIGLLQVFSLIPGVSRSGITITGARFFGFSRSEAAKISFLFSIPTLIVVCSYNILKIIELKNIEITFQNILAIFLSFIFSTITLKFFIKFLKRFSLMFFVVYRIVLGVLILIYVYN